MNENDIKQKIIHGIKKRYYKYFNLPEEYLEDWDIIVNACWTEKSIMIKNKNLLENEDFLIKLLKNKTAINIFKKSIPLVMWSNKKIGKHIIEKEPNCFYKLSERLKCDSDILWMVVESESNIGSYINEDLKKNKEFMRKVFHKFYYNFQYADISIRGDKNEVKEIVTKYFILFEHLSDELKDDKEFLLEVLKNNPSLKHSHVIELIGPNLKKDKEVVLRLLDLGSYLKGIDPSLENDKEVIELAIKKSSCNIEFAGKDFKSDANLLLNYINKEKYYYLKHFDLSIWNNSMLISFFNNIEMNESVYRDILFLKPLIQKNHVLYETILNTKNEVKNNIFLLKLFMLNNSFSKIYKELEFPLDLQKALDKKPDIINTVNYYLLKDVLNETLDLKKPKNKMIKF